MTLNVSDDALIAHLEGEAVLLNMATKEYYRLNETAQAVWRLFETGTGEPGDVVRGVLAQYAVSAAAAEPEVRRVIDDLLAAGLLEPAPAA